MQNSCALTYHSSFPSGKIGTAITKPLGNADDLSLAYSPGVAEPCMEIAKNPNAARLYTSRGNLVAVVTDGTAVLGLGNIGPLASKPVMEGKAALFKVLANVDAFDIELDTTDVDHFVDVVRAIEPTFGAINLEDISAPSCFEIEKRLKEALSIPVFHDDQHGTAIVVSAAMLNYLRWTGKKIDEVRVVVCGAGAAAIASLDLLSELGMRAENVVLGDALGVVDLERSDIHPRVRRYAREHGYRELREALEGADIFLGLSVGNAIPAEWIAEMAISPLVLALANPVPDVCLEKVAAIRNDAIIGSGRSDRPNQVNNVACFPYIFRGALDAEASEINRDMMIAAAWAIADIAHSDHELALACGQSEQPLGPLLPNPLDGRLCANVAAAVASAAVLSGVSKRNNFDVASYASALQDMHVILARHLD
jgi:malate dehydrogenase (oxaloacetate-decarboxylating)(NADP+)